MMALMKDLWVKQGIYMKYICCDNAGKNNTFHKLCKEEEIGIKLIYTMLGMPQQNGRVEHKFATLYNRVCAM